MRSSAASSAFAPHELALLVADHRDRRLDEIAHDLLDVAADIADLGEFGRLNLQEWRAGELGEAARNLGLAAAGRPDHQDVFRQHLLAHRAFEAKPPPAVAQGDGDGALGVMLADDETVEFGDDLAGGKISHRKNRSCGLRCERMGKAPCKGPGQQAQRGVAQGTPPGADRQHEHAKRQQRRRRRFLLDAGAMDQRAEGKARIGQRRDQKGAAVDDDGDEPKPEKYRDDGDGAPRVEIGDAAEKAEDQRLHDERRGEKMQPEGDVGLARDPLGIRHVEAHRRGEHGEAAGDDEGAAQMDVEAGRNASAKAMIATHAIAAPAATVIGTRKRQ